MALVYTKFDFTFLKNFFLKPSRFYMSERIASLVLFLSSFAINIRIEFHFFVAQHLHNHRTTPTHSVGTAFGCINFLLKIMENKQGNS